MTAKIALPTVVFSTAIFLLLACSEEPASAIDTGEADLSRYEDVLAVVFDLGEELDPLIWRVDVVENPSNMLSYFIDWTTTRAVPTYLEVDCPEVVTQTFSQPEPRTEHSVFLMGLLEGAACDIKIRAVDRWGIEEEHQTSFEVATPLPTFVPQLEMNLEGIDSMQPGWTMFNLWHMDGSDKSLFVIVDEQGRFRWYHRRNGRDYDLTPLEDFFIAGAFTCCTSAFVGWDGTLLWEAPFTTHHDVRPSPFEEGNYLYLGHTRVCTDGTREDTANEFDFSTGEATWEWIVCDHYIPDRIYDNWSHINTIEPFPGERAVLLSSRDQNRMWKVDRDTGEIRWTLGEDGDFLIAPDDRFYYQHAPEIQPNGNILLYDNGHDPQRMYSRVVELELSFYPKNNPRSAHVVWEYVDPALFTPAKGEADRLPNGNTLITYGGLRPNRNSMIREVTHEGEVVWQLAPPIMWSIYRSERITDPFFGEVR